MDIETVTENTSEQLGSSQASITFYRDQSNQYNQYLMEQNRAYKEKIIEFQNYVFDIQRLQKKDRRRHKCVQSIRVSQMEIEGTPKKKDPVRRNAGVQTQQNQNDILA